MLKTDVCLYRNCSIFFVFCENVTHSCLIHVECLIEVVTKTDFTVHCDNCMPETSTWFSVYKCTNLQEKAPEMQRLMLGALNSYAPVICISRPLEATEYQRFKLFNFQIPAKSPALRGKIYGKIPAKYPKFWNKISIFSPIPRWCHMKELCT